MSYNIESGHGNGNAEWHPAVPKQIHVEGEDKGKLVHESGQWPDSSRAESQITEDAAGLEASLRALGTSQEEIDAKVKRFIRGKMEPEIRSESKKLVWEEEKSEGRKNGSDFWKSVSSNNELASKQIDELIDK